MSSITITNMSECSKCQILFQFWDHLVACFDAWALSAVIRKWSVRRSGSGSRSIYKNPLPDVGRIWRNFWAYWHIWESFLFKSTSHSDCESCACCGKCSFSGPLEWVMRGRGELPEPPKIHIWQTRERVKLFAGGHFSSQPLHNESTEIIIKLSWFLLGKNFLVCQIKNISKYGWYFCSGMLLCQNSIVRCFPQTCQPTFSNSAKSDLHNLVDKLFDNKKRTMTETGTMKKATG